MRREFRDLIVKFQDNCARIREMADLCEKEQRERNEAEEREFVNLTRENQVLQMRIQSEAAAAYGNMSVPAVDTDAMLRERLLNRQQNVTIAMMREVTPQTTAALADTGIIPVQEQEILGPVRKGLIWDKVGITIRSGLAGTLRWPIHGKAVASFADEAERLVDSKIDFDKLTMSGKRLGIAIPVTREELENSTGIVDSVVRSEAPNAIIDLINDAIFATSLDYQAADGTTKQRKTYGPFVGLASSPAAFAGAVPTRKELLKMFASVASKIDLRYPCWVMTDAMKAELMDVKVDAGSGRFLCENDMILGRPVFTTSAIGESFIGFGDWGYQAAGFFGQASFVADPYTLLRQNSVDFVLNSHFGTVTLRKDAFALGKVKSE